MRKIPTIFKREGFGRQTHIVDSVTPGCEWVIAGEGIAMRKFDGEACKIEGGKLWKRYDAKPGRKPPVGFVACQDPDIGTGHWPGWVPVGDGPEDREKREALAHGLYENGVFGNPFPDGTYEFLSPTFKGRDSIKQNPENVGCPILVRHNAALACIPRTYHELQQYFFTGHGSNIEGIVWHHPDGRMAKIKRRDFK